MSFKPITPFSLVDQTFDRIADAIYVGQIQPGERIREAQLAKALGVSRGVLREAMQRLEGRKLVTRTSNIGVHVKNLSRDDLYELFTLREALEGMAARLAAEHMTDEERRGLKDLLYRHSEHQDIKRGAGYYQASEDEDFHFRIARGSRNGRLEHALCDELYYQLRLYRYRSSVREGRAKAAFAEHERVVQAIVDGRPGVAEDAMREHLAHARANLTWSALDGAGDGAASKAAAA
jgi:DNA-binding GntR family transcriptional regulator